MVADANFTGVIPPPPGITPDPDHRQSDARALLLAWLIIFDVLNITFFLTRAYVKIWVTRKILAEDGETLHP